MQDMLSDAYPASVLSSTSLLTARSLKLDGWPSASSLIFIYSIHLIIWLCHFLLLNISHIHLLLFSSLTSTPDWLGRDFLSRIHAMASYRIPCLSLATKKPSSETQVEPNHSCSKPFNGFPTIHQSVRWSVCLSIHPPMYPSIHQLPHSLVHSHNKSLWILSNTEGIALDWLLVQLKLLSVSWERGEEKPTSTQGGHGT